MYYGRRKSGRSICRSWGQVQMEILKNILWERFGLEAEFDAGSIV